MCVCVVCVCVCVCVWLWVCGVTWANTHTHTNVLNQVPTLEWTDFFLLWQNKVSVWVCKCVCVCAARSNTHKPSICIISWRNQNIYSRLLLLPFCNCGPWRHRGLDWVSRTQGSHTRKFFPSFWKIWENENQKKPLFSIFYPSPLPFFTLFLFRLSLFLPFFSLTRKIWEFFFWENGKK